MRRSTMRYLTLRDVGVHSGDVEAVVVGRSRRRGYIDIEVVSVSVLCRVLVEQFTAQLDGIDEVRSIGRIFRIFPVNYKLS